MVPKVRPYDPFLGEKGPCFVNFGPLYLYMDHPLLNLVKSFFCYFFLCPICVFGALCHSKSFHEKYLLGVLMKCQVSVLIAQQHFFFFRRFFLLSKLSVSALFFPHFKKCSLSNVLSH